MRVPRILLVALICLAACECVYAQRSTRVTHSRLHFSNPKVKGAKAKIVCPTFDKSRYPLHGLGFKLGDPFAITYKYYPNKRFSFALDVGKAASGLYNKYFQEKFGMYLQSDTLPSSESRLTYIGHRVKTDLVADVKLLYHVNAEKISAGLQAYAGVGWEWKNTELRYDYEYNQDLTSPQLSEPFGSFDRKRVTMGPQFVVGIEYAYFRIPVAAFMEVEYFTDIQADPGWQRFEGGVGLRYVF